MGKHARHKYTSVGYDPPAFGMAGEPGHVKSFDDNHGRHVIGAADKRLHGEYPYDLEPGSKAAVDRNTGKRR